MLDDYTASLLCPCTYGLKRELGDIAQSVAMKHGISVKLLMSRRRTHAVASARQEFYAMASEHRYTCSKIAKFAGRDHATVLHGISAHYERKNTIQVYSGVLDVASNRKNPALGAGVSYNKRTGAYTAAIRANGKRMHLGTFQSNEDAAEAYKAAFVKYRCTRFG